MEKCDRLSTVGRSEPRRITHGEPVKRAAGRLQSVSLLPRSLLLGCCTPPLGSELALGLLSAVAVPADLDEVSLAGRSGQP